MPRFAVCVEMIFKYLPFLERLESLRGVGLSAFEFWDWSGKDIDAIAEKKRELGVECSTFVVCPRISSLTRSDVKDDFVSSVKASAQVAKKLDCSNLIGPVGLGKATPNLTRRQQLRNALNNLKSVAPLLEETEITLLIEPVNLRDHKGCFLSRTAEAAQLIGLVGSRRVKILYDFYHQQISEGNLINNAQTYFDLIGFFHIGDVPGRHEPGTGEINYRNISNRES